MNRIFRHKRVIFLTIAMICVSFFIAFFSILILYNHAVNDLQSRLSDLVKQEKNTILTIYEDNKNDIDHIIYHIKDIHKDNFTIGKSGEIAIAKIVGDSIVFIISQKSMDNPYKIPLNSAQATQIKLACQGKTGNQKGIDYQGENVFASLTFIEELGWGMVAKLPTKEFNRHYKILIVWVLIITIILITICIFVFIKIANPLINEIAQNEHKFRLLFEKSPDEIIISTITGEFIACNQAALKFHGFNELSQIKKFTIDETYQNQSESITVIKELFRNGYIRNKELNIKSLNSDVISTFLVSVELLQIKKSDVILLYTYRNINERKIQEEQLLKAKEKAEESQEQYWNLIETLGEGFFSTDEKGYITKANKLFAILSNYNSPNEMIGLHMQQLFANPEDRDTMINKIEEKKILHNYELLLKTKTGVPYWTLNNIKLMYNKNGEVIGTEGLIRDISLLKKFEYELIAAKEKAEESDSLKTAFLQNMSHEIRTPLNAISGFAGLLNEPDLTEKKRNKFIQIIQNSSNQLVSIVSDILTISSLETKQESVNITNVCINRIITDLYIIFKQQALNQNISLFPKKTLNDKQSEIYTDRTKITQILSNLLSNALKFTHSGYIEFGYELRNNLPIEMLSPTNNKQNFVNFDDSVDSVDLFFYVKDSGIGIKPEYHKSIFERFRQADKSIQTNYGGTGLGLAISKAFVELLGGKIWVLSELDKGSTFYFTIPYNHSHKSDNINFIKNKKL